MDWHIIIPMTKNAGTNEEIGDKIGEKITLLTMATKSESWLHFEAFSPSAKAHNFQ